jgi:N-acetylglucosaminyldiphosphoundecaprenol N-acetyl-beta-D-mannosaminyltransferase
MCRTLDASQTAGWRHYLYGTSPGTLDALQAAIRRRWPAARLAGFEAPPFGPRDDAAECRSLDRINAARPDIVWLGLGCPRQEEWMRRYRRDLDAAVVVAVGAAFDFIAGAKPQAPPWMQRHGLEWLFRLGCEPRRLWRRYLTRNPYFLWQVLLQRLGLRWR